MFSKSFSRYDDGTGVEIECKQLLSIIVRGLVLLFIH